MRPIQYHWSRVCGDRSLFRNSVCKLDLALANNLDLALANNNKKNSKRVVSNGDGTSQQAVNYGTGPSTNLGRGWGISRGENQKKIRMALSMLASRRTTRKWTCNMDSLHTKAISVEQMKGIAIFLSELRRLSQADFDICSLELRSR